jgi:ketosteroid isomerase-like protein
MRWVLAAVLASLLAVSPAMASDKSDVWAEVHQFADAVNKGDPKLLLAQCGALTSIIDDFAPHLWQGATACADWAKSFGDWAKQNSVTDAAVTLHRPLHVDITGDRAYVVAEADFTYKEKGKRKADRGSAWTMVLQKSGTGWQILGWAWADR